MQRDDQMELLEREDAFETLQAAFQSATDGIGQFVLICGEAGIGKTSLVTQFAKLQKMPLRFLRGTCDPFNPPHPLCPLIDIASQIPDEELSRMLWEPARPVIFHSFFEKIQSSKTTTIVVFEDIHWADEATHDVLIFLVLHHSES